MRFKLFIAIAAIFSIFIIYALLLALLLSGGSIGKDYLVASILAFSLGFCAYIYPDLAHKITQSEDEEFDDERRKLYRYTGLLSMFSGICVLVLGFEFLTPTVLSLLVLITAILMMSAGVLYIVGFSYNESTKYVSAIELVLLNIIVVIASIGVTFSLLTLKILPLTPLIIIIILGMMYGLSILGTSHLIRSRKSQRDQI